jgi:hypothetical protein
MKFIWILALFPLLSSTDCQKKKRNGDDAGKPDSTIAAIPSCIQSRIDSIQLLPKWNPPAQVDEYTYNNKRVFVFTADCCDQFNVAYDEDCHIVCAPSGGIAGSGDGKCPDFANATHVRLVWKDPR